MNRKLLISAAAISALCFAFGLAACGNETGNGENGHVHTAEAFGSDEDVHWKVCTDCGETFADGDHVYKGSNTCTECGYTIPETAGLEYELDEETDTYAVTGIGTAGAETKIYIPAYHDGKAVTVIDYGAFFECNFTAVKIPSTVERIEGSAFGDCNSLTELKVPDSVTFFQGVGGNAVLKSVTFGKNSKLEEVGKATFGYCPELTDVNLPDSVRLIEDDTFEESKIYTDKSFWTDGILYVGNHMIAVDETVSGKVTVREGTKTIAEAAFLYSGDVTEVVLPASLVGLHDYKGEGLKNLTIPKNVEIIGSNAFNDIHDLDHITVESGNAFYNDGNGSDCLIETATNKLVLGSNNTKFPLSAGVTEICAHAFSGCTFESFTIPDGVTVIGSIAFSGCSALTSVEIPASVTSLGYGLFSECTALKNIVFKGSVNDWKALTEKSWGWDSGTEDPTQEITFTISCNDGTVSKDGTVIS